MMVSELLTHLMKMPGSAKVRYVWDGEARTEVGHLWLARCGDVILHGDDSEPVYTGEDRPLNAPDEKQDPYWSPENGKGCW